MRLGVYYWWSRVYRRIYGGKYAGVVLPTCRDLTDLRLAVAMIRWRADGIMELGDAISTARMAWGRHEEGVGSDDCDDIAAFSADRLEDMASRPGPYAEDVAEIGDIRILTVSWRVSGLKSGGHNVCLFSHREAGGPARWGYISNWYDGNPRLGFASPLDVVADVLAGADRPDPLGAAVVTTDLRLEKWWSGKEIDAHLR